VPRDVSKYVANVWNARRHLEHEVLQLRVEEEWRWSSPLGISTRQTSVMRLGRM
jgi:hypothetical protein